MVWEPMKYRIIFLITSHELTSCRLSEEKPNAHISLKYPNKESGKILKNETAEPHLEPCQISIMGRF